MPYPAPMRDLYKRLAGIGFPAAYVREVILPDWWDDSIASQATGREMAEIAIARVLRTRPSRLANPNDDLSIADDPSLRFKRWEGARRTRLIPSAVVGKRVAELVINCLRDLPPCRLEGISASQIRSMILDSNQYVGLSSLVDLCWDLGVPVVYVESLPKGAKRVEGIALQIQGHPVVILASSRRAPAWLVWHLAHEMGHIACGHLTEDGIVVDEAAGPPGENEMSETTQEREADAFAKELVYKNTEFTARYHLTGAQLAHEAKRIGPKYRVDPCAIVTHYAYKMGAWGTAQNALNDLGSTSGGPEIVRDYLRQRVEPDRLTDTDHHFLSATTGLDNH